METPKEDIEMEEEKKPIEEQVEEKSEGIIDSIKDTTEDIMESITDKKDEIVSSIKETREDIAESIQEKKDGISKSIGSGVKKTKSFFRKVIIGSIVLFILSIGVYMIYANWTYSEGTRAGNLIKISKKGYIFKTYEGQLKLGGIDLSNPEEGMSDSWSFSVRDEGVFKELEKRQGQKVVLRYKQINHAMPWQGDTDYYIYAVE